MYLISEQEVVWCSIIQTGCCTTITIQIKRSHWPDHWYSQYVVCWYPPPDATLGWWRRHVCHQLTSLSCTSCHCTPDDANYRSHTSSCTAPWSHCHACAVLSCTCTVILSVPLSRLCCTLLYLHFYVSPTVTPCPDVPCPNRGYLRDVAHTVISRVIRQTELIVAELKVSEAWSRIQCILRVWCDASELLWLSLLSL